MLQRMIAINRPKFKLKQGVGDNSGPKQAEVLWVGPQISLCNSFDIHLCSFLLWKYFSFFSYSEVL